MHMNYYDFMKKVAKKSQHYFTAFFEKNELNGYTVTVPSLPGLVTEGRTFEEASEMAKEAIVCYVGGLKKAKQPLEFENEVGSFKVSVVI